jgi:peptidoglycan/LPS O-acetylase OafA/YrhL
MKTNYRALTSLRFFAAIAIVVFHYGSEIKGIDLLPKPAKALMNCGPLALCFFFALSGFVLSISYRERISTSTKARAFWLARFARLYPAYLLSYLLFLPMALQKYILHPAAETSASAHKTFWAGAILSPLLLQSWTSVSQAWNGPSWSLSVETFFYLLFPYIAFRLMRQVAAGAATVSAGLWAASLVVVYTHVTGHLSSQYYHGYIQYNPLFWAPCFVVGIEATRFVAPWQKVSGAFASATTLLTLATIILICVITPPSYRGFIVTTGLLPILALLIICCSHESSRVVNMIGSSPIFELGSVSYVIYIIQSPIWHFVTLATNKLAGRSSISGQVAAWQFIVFLPVLILVSFLVNRCIEGPARTWIMQGWAGRPTNRVRETSGGETYVEGVAGILSPHAR